MLFQFRLRLLTILVVSLFSCLSHSTDVEGENPLQAQGQLSPIQIQPQQGAEVRFKLYLPEGYRAYADMFKLEAPTGSKFKVGGIHITSLQDFYDEFSKKTKKGVIKEAELIAPVEAPADFEGETSPLKFRLTYQACTKTYCLFPTTIEVPVEFAPQADAARTTPTETLAIEDLLQKPFAEVLKNQSLALVFVLVFLAGLLTSLTPCIFPMIPITMAVLGREAHARTKTKTMVVSVLYVLGIALTYATLGLLAASTGALFGSFMSSPWVLGSVCLVFLAMSLSMFGLYDLEPPLWIRNRLSGSNLHGYSGVFLTGVLAGVVASPCVGPVLVGILTYVAQTKDLWLGFWALFVFALGMGQLFLVLGAFSSATRLLPKSGAWMDGVKHFFGLLMLFAFYYYLHLLIPERTFDAAIGLGLILLGSLKGAFEVNFKSHWTRARKGLCQALIIIGAFFLIVSIFDLRESLQRRMISETQTLEHEQRWQNYTPALLEEARQKGQPVILDFYADWSAACKELEQFTFTTVKFKTATEGVTLLRFDATADSPELKNLKETYRIVGLPTVVFIDGKGRWREDLTLTEFEKVDPFVERVRKLKSL